MHGIISEFACEFDKLSHLSAACFEPLARKTTYWPALISIHKDVAKSNEKLIAALHLGADAELNYSGKQWSRKYPETSVAVELHCLLGLYRREWLERKAQKKLINDSWKDLNKRCSRPANYRPPMPKMTKLQPAMAEEFRLYDKSRLMARKLAPLNRKNYLQWYKASLPAFEARYGKEFQDHKKFVELRERAEATATKQKRKLYGIFRKLILKNISNAFRSIAPKAATVE